MNETLRYRCPVCRRRALDVTHRPQTIPTVLVHCFHCAAPKREIAAALGIRENRLYRWPPPAELGPPGGERNGARPTSGPPLSEATVDGAVSALWAETDALDWLYGRGLTDRTIRKYQLGLWRSDKDGDAILFPIRDRAGSLVRFKRRFLAPDADPKMWNSGGHAVLYPLPILNDKPRRVVLCEGELDALLLNQHGIPTLTSTASKSWRPEWSEHMRDREVAVLYDAGSLAFSEARTRARELKEAGAADAWPVDLPLAEEEDVGDWFMTYQRTADELRDLIDNFRRLWPRRKSSPKRAETQARYQAKPGSQDTTVRKRNPGENGQRREYS